MIPSGNLLAWIEPSRAGGFVAAFVSEYTSLGGRSEPFSGRAPATQVCSSSEEAHQWVEDQAANLDLPVRWVRDMPQTQN